MRALPDTDVMGDKLKTTYSLPLIIERLPKCEPVWFLFLFVFVYSENEGLVP